MRRGEVWRALILGRRERMVVVVGHDRVTEAASYVLVVHVEPTEGTPSILSVTLTEPVAGYLRAVSVGPITKTSMVERLGTLDADTMARVDNALRAALDL